MDLTYRFNMYLKTHRDPRLISCLDVACINSSGKVWLVGGYLYRSLAKEMYSYRKPLTQNVDFDFLVECQNANVISPPGWSKERNRYGGWKFKYPEMNISMDLQNMPEVFSIRTQNMPSRIESYFSGVPLSVQAVAYDFDSCRIIGEVGIQSLKYQAIRFNHIGLAAYASGIKGISLSSMLQTKAESLSFGFETCAS
jgi:hypothetical protein